MNLVAERFSNLLVRFRDPVWRPTPGGLRVLALLTVLANMGIIVTGGAVRLTKSGLGCPTWPQCTAESMLPASAPDHSPVNMAIEFGNRMVTFLILAVAVAVYVAALRSVPRRPAIIRLALIQPLGVVAQAAWGGLTVLTDLHPAVVAGHYLLSAALLAAAVLLYVRTGEGDEAPRPVVAPWLRGFAALLAVVTVALLVAGTLVTGTGPHAGDDKAPRFGFDLELVARVHGLLAWASVAMTIVLLLALHRSGAPSTPRRRAAELFAIELGQGAVGYLQYFLGVPAPLVALHMLGSALMWIAVLRVLFAMRERGPVPPTPSPTFPASSQVTSLIRA
jgi:heme a synthase